MASVVCTQDQKQDLDRQSDGQVVEGEGGGPEFPTNRTGALRAHAVESRVNLTMSRGLCGGNAISARLRANEAQEEQSQVVGAMTSVRL